uniref:Cytoplasmic polyadenylation element binding protein 3 n=1 Tax=Callorhinchus milii TaxID=7868 RepID=A0A4W3JXG0_CALMI
MTSKPSSAWNNHQNTTWSAAPNPWSGLQARDPRRAVGVPSPLNPISPLKKPFSSNVIAPPKFPRTAPALPKSWMEDNAFRTDNSNGMLQFQDRNRPYDAFNLHSLESSLMDIMRSDHEPLKGRSSLFPIEDGFLDDGHGDQSLTSGLNSPTRCQNGERVERYSRKVFVGGLPPDIDEDEITASFRRFGPLVVDWPHKAESKSYFPPKGYAFLLFQEESSVQALIDACIEEDGKLYLCVSSPTIKDKPVQIRPWNLSDSDFVMDGSQPLDPRKTIFVGGVPRPLRAVELAMIMDRLYGGVCYAGIDTDPELKYPKGAGRVAFSNQQSYIAAISARFVQLQHGDIDKRVEVKPYVLDDQMCDECQGARCGGKFAPFFCANVTCLQYYCEYCWASIHSRAGREFHKPLVKEGGDRPRHVPFRWS